MYTHRRWDMSPYLNPLTPISDITPYFKKNKDGSIIFIGESLELRIPSKFQQYGALIISDNVSTFGIFDMIINDKFHVGFNLLAPITICPSDISQMTYANIEYVVLTLSHGDTFMTSTRVLQDPNVVYVLWSEWITSGKVAYWMTYDSLLKVFENVKELTGQGIGVSRSVFEGIVAHISRDQDDVTKLYRLSDMTKPAKMIALNAIGVASTSTISRLNGSYFADEGLTSALRHEVDQQQPFENILRGYPHQV